MPRRLVIKNLEQSVAELARVLKDRFTQPEYIPGCEVKDVTNADDYGQDNGWIEAICGQHNQQRVRYKGIPPAVEVGDYVDVEYFPNHKLFEVRGGGYSTGANLTQTKVSKVWQPDLTATVMSGDNNGDSTFDGDLYVPGDILRAGDPDTGLVLSADQIELDVAGQTNIDVQQSIVIINADNEDVDTNIRGDTEQNLFYANAGLDSIGIGKDNPAEMLDVAGNINSDQAFQANAYDFPLLQLGGDGAHFRDNDGSYPAGWTEADAAETSVTNTLYSAWYLVGSSTETSWKYRIQAATDLENDLGSGDGLAYVFGPISFKTTAFTADVDYYFGIYRDNSGIDEDTFSRVHLQWDSAGSQWRIRGELKDSSSDTEWDGSWEIFSVPINNRVWIAVTVVNNATKLCQQYYGPFFVPNSDSANQFLTQLNQRTPSTALTWGQLWIQFHQTRGAGGNDRILIGSWDRTD